jgi:hypothetical protein
MLATAMRQVPAGVRAMVVAAAIAVSIGCAPAAAQTPGAPVVPIPTDPGNSSVNPFEGSAASPNPVGGMTPPPQHPFMAPNGRNNIHDDAYMTDTYALSGPLADGPEVSTLFFRECASVMFDSAGRIVTICVGLDRPVLALLHPQTLQTLAAMPLPVRNPQSSSNPFNDFSGGGYFYLDQLDRAVLATNDRHVLEVAITGEPGFTVTRDYDLNGHVATNEGIISVLPDWSGRLWFVTRRGKVGTIDRSSGAVQSMQLAGEGISNSFAVDEDGGVFIVSDQALYRFDSGPSGAPTITWRLVYPNSSVQKPSQSDAGSGTTPTLMGRNWVAITDNADPMNVQVYERAKQLDPQTQRKAKKKRKKKGKRRAAPAGKRRKKKRKKKGRQEAKQRLVCSEPVFRAGASATDNSLIATDTSIVVENNYGYSGLASTMNGGVTEPGLTRVDVVKLQAQKKKKKKRKKKKGKGRAAAKGKKKKQKRKKGGQVASYGCRTVWTSAERAPSVVPKLSLANGLVYTYTKPPRSDDIDAWYLTALDFRTGQTVFRRLAGTGFGHNNNYAPVTLGPDGTAYVGVLGGLVAFR